MKEKLFEVWDWLVISSEDPRNLSLTLKGFIPFVSAAGVWFGFDLGEGVLISVVDAIVTAVVSGVGLVSALVSLFGFVRKISNSVK